MFSLHLVSSYCYIEVARGSLLPKMAMRSLPEPDSPGCDNSLSRNGLPEGDGSLLSLFAENYELTLGDWKIKSVSRDDAEMHEPGTSEIFLQDTASGWGTGEHPTTLLCLQFLKEKLKEGDRILDYGAGSGILSIFGIKALGAESATAVDIDEDTLVALEANAALNGLQDKIDVTHTRMVYLGEDRFPEADVTVANILPGPLTRLVAPIYGFTKPNGWLCLSGMRRHELPAVRAAYHKYIDEDTENISSAYHDTFGEWVCYSARMKDMGVQDRKKNIEELSKLAME